jgi:hypothetical protein
MYKKSLIGILTAPGHAAKNKFHFSLRLIFFGARFLLRSKLSPPLFLLLSQLPDRFNFGFFPLYHSQFSHNI